MGTERESFVAWLKKQQSEGDLQTKTAKAESAGSTLGIPPQLLEKAKVELQRMVKVPGNTEPDRGDLEEPKITWRHGKPNYTLANLAFLKGKCKYHETSSLEMLVENTVKTWEMEASHKEMTDQWTTIDHENYCVQTNGGRVFELEEAASRGNYNVLMDHVDKCLYNAASEDFDSSHVLFRSAFEHSFPWELLEVYAGPPDILFSWRHWGEFTGDYKGNKGEGQLLELTGFASVSVTPELKITEIRAFYNPEKFLRELRGEHEPDEVDDSVAKTIGEQLQKLAMKDMPGEGCEIEVNGTLVEEFLKDLENALAKLLPMEVTEVFSRTSEFTFTWKHSEGINGFGFMALDDNNQLKSLRIYHKA